MKTIFAAALVAGTMFGFGAVNAAPITPATPSVQSDIIQVAGGCGRGFHRGPRGGCRVNRGGFYVAPPRYYAPRRYVRRCPPGMFWRHGRCWR